MLTFILQHTHAFNYDKFLSDLFILQLKYITNYFQLNLLEKLYS